MRPLSRVFRSARRLAAVREPAQIRSGRTPLAPPGRSVTRAVVGTRGACAQGGGETLGRGPVPVVGSIAIAVACVAGTPGCDKQGSSNAPRIVASPAAVTDPPIVTARPEAVLAAPKVFEPAPEIVRAAKLLSEAAQRQTTAWERLAWMCDRFGVRLSGSPGLEAAIDWAVETMRADGLDSARKEPVMVPRWVRGSERARMLAPVERELVILGLGNTVGTGKKPLRAEVVVVADLEAIDQAGAALEGKIVVIDEPMPAYDHERRNSNYGTAVQKRLHGAARAAKHGAKAVLIRSVTARSLRSPHTGAVLYAEGVPKIPAAALSVEDAAMLSRWAARGERIELELSLGAKTLADAPSGNAVAEIKGRELPEEIVLIGCHIDAWDVGDGANDDGVGCMMALDGARMLVAAGLVGRRTIRVVLFTNEENGGRGGKAYFEAHGHEKHVAAMEADSGSGAPWGFGIGGTPEDFDALEPYAPLFAELGADHFSRGGGGADIAPLVRNGVMGISVSPDGSAYFDVHHSHADTVDKIKPGDLQKNAAAMALLAFVLAER